MKYILSILFFSLLHLQLDAQINLNKASNNQFEISTEYCSKKVKRITQIEKGEVKRIVEYTKQGQVCFIYKIEKINRFYNSFNIYHIKAFEYNANGKVIKAYTLHSDKGHRIEYTTWDTNQYKSETYHAISPEDLINRPKNSDAYIEISKFKGLEDVIFDKEIIRINTLKPKKLSKVRFNKAWDVEEKTIINKEYSYKIELKYDRLGRVSYSDMNYDNFSIEEEYSYPKPRITQREVYISSINKARYLKAIDITETNKNGKVISEYFGGLDTKVEVKTYAYNVNGQLTKCISVEGSRTSDSILGPLKDMIQTSEIQYEYTKDGLVAKEIIGKQNSKEKLTYKYKYKIEYFK